jgi:hypothetical protein
MTKVNNIVKNDLEYSAIELRGAGKSNPEIANALSIESQDPISASSVFRYFAAHDFAAVQAIEKSDKLKVRIADAEINTINKRVEIIDSFISIAEHAAVNNDYRTAVMALNGATKAQDFLDERLGKLKAPTSTNNINILNIHEEVQRARDLFTRERSRMVEITTGSEEN